MHLGIDFGTWYTSAVLWRGEGQPLAPVKDPNQHAASIPSCLYYGGGGEWLFGHSAWNGRRRDPRRFAHEDLKGNLLAHGGSEPLSLGEADFSLEELIGRLLGWIKQEADRMALSWGGPPLAQATLTVPVDYGPARRELMAQAARRAGFGEVELLDEPVAAALSVLRQGRIQPGETVLIYDLGGGTFDAALVRQDGAQFEVLAKDGLPQCGGVHFDHAIYRWLAARVGQDQAALAPLLERGNPDIQAWRLRLNVRENCQGAKHQLSGCASSEIEVPAGDYPSYRLSRAELEGLLAALLRQTLDACRRVLREGQVRPESLGHIVMVGGSARIPAVAELLRQAFGKDPILAADPELAIAEGAALRERHGSAPRRLPPPQSLHGLPARQVRALQRQAAQALGRPVVFRDPLWAGGAGPEMVVIPAGWFLMGSPPGEPERFDDEGPQHEVCLARPFAIGRYAVTFEEYDRYCKIVGAAKPGDRGWGRGRRPAINVSWHDAQAYCAWLGAQTGRRYRLPSEAEWEYACRAGTAGPFCWGGAITPRQANYGGNRGMTVPVDQFEPNAFGLHQMQGNVWEWCEDCWHKDYDGAPEDGSAWDESNIYANGGRRVIRGGSWNYDAGYLRPAFRYGYSPGYRIITLGFRLAQD